MPYPCPVQTRLILSALAGLGLSLAFEPVALFWIVFPAMGLLLWCLRDRSAKQGLAIGAVFGGGFMFVHIWWMRAVAEAAWVGLAGIETLFLAFAGAGMAVASRTRWWPVTMSVVWLAVEVFRGGWPFSGFMWGRLSFAVVDTPFAAPLPWIGSNGVSLLIVLAAAGLLWWYDGPRRRLRAAAGGLAALVAVLGVPALVGPQWTTDETAVIGLVQGDVPGDGTEVVAHHRDITRRHVELTVALGAAADAGTAPRPDFVVWPENSTAVDPFTDLPTRDGIREAVAGLGAPVLVGAMVDHEDDDKVLNQGIVEDPVTGTGDTYTKRHPVPFGEFIPFRNLIPEGSNVGRLAEIPRDMVAGTDKDPLDIAGIRVADAICFDVSYDDVFVDQVRRGARVAVVQTSNAMFIHTAQIDQQFAMSRLRAIETGRTVVVAAINGRSGIIGPDGRVVADLDKRTSGTAVAEVALAEGTPPSMYVGPWVGRLALWAALVGLCIVAITYRRTRRSEGSPADQEDAG